MQQCPFCFSESIQEVLNAREMTRGTRELFRYALCSRCSSTYNLDFPRDIASYYRDYYSFGEDSLSLEGRWWKRLAVNLYAACVVRPGLSKFLRYLFRCPGPWEMRALSPNLQAFLFIGAKPSARILDVGSGQGQFVRVMRRFGYENVLGIDPFLDPMAERRYVKRRSIEDQSGQFDVILFNHSLEHTATPETSLQRSAALLAPDGVIVVHVPNMGAREFTNFRENWCWLHAPYHFGIPSRQGLQAMANRCGLKVADAICTSRYDHYLYHDEYRRDIGDRDATSERRKIEDQSFEKRRWVHLSRLARDLNEELTGDWIAYYLVNAAG